MKKFQKSYKRDLLTQTINSSTLRLEYPTSTMDSKQFAERVHFMETQISPNPLSFGPIASFSRLPPGSLHPLPFPIPNLAQLGGGPPPAFPQFGMPFPGMRRKYLHIKSSTSCSLADN